MEIKEIENLNMQKGCHNLTSRIMNGKAADYWNLYHTSALKIVVLNDTEFNQVVSNNTRQTGLETGQYAIAAVYVQNDEDATGYLCVRETFFIKQ